MQYNDKLNLKKLDQDLITVNKKKKKVQKIGMENWMKGIFLMCAVFSISSIVFMIYFIFSSGIPFITEYGVARFLTGTTWAPSNTPGSYGILPMMIGSILVTGGATLIGMPIGILTAVFMAAYCPPALYKILKAAVNLMAAIPSILYGFFALQFIVPFMREVAGGTGMNMMTAMILLGLMILPTIISLSEAALRVVPRSYYEGSLALGATHEKTVLSVMVPAAKSGIISSVILGIGRAIGETMAVVLIAGNQPIIPDSLFSGVRTLTTNIVLEMAYAQGEHKEALIATAAVLFLFILMINSLFLYVKKKRG